MKSLELFVMSDLHAFDGERSDGQRPSWYDISESEGGNPIRDLASFIKKNKITSDYLLFGGDLADKACPRSTLYAWTEMQQITTLLGAKMLIATAGNHDVDSRHVYNDHDAIGCLLDLNPCFPLYEETSSNQYWAHHFAVYQPEDVKARFVTINSCGYHGTTEEHKHGRISERTLKRMRRVLDKSGKMNANIAIVHHHPQTISEYNLGDADNMKGGYEFLSALSATDYGPWLVIHGHKHFAKLIYAQGETLSPLVFSTGSCAAIPFPEIQGKAGIQVYKLTIELHREHSTTCWGRFESWDWSLGEGWRQSNGRSGLPSSGGFGHRCDVGAFANQIAASVGATAKMWTDIESEFVALRYMIPGDIRAVVKLLKQDHSMRIELGEHGNPIVIQR